MVLQNGMKKVFLSGPIRGVSRDISLGWRNKIVNLLETDFIVIHALRGREIIETLPDPRLAIIRDKNDIDESNVLIVNDSFPDASMIGTSMEVIYAFERGKIIIIFGNAHEKDYWLNYHSHIRVATLEDACLLVRNFFK